MGLRQAPKYLVELEGIKAGQKTYSVGRGSSYRVAAMRAMESLVGLFNRQHPLESEMPMVITMRPHRTPDRERQNGGQQ